MLELGGEKSIYPSDWMDGTSEKKVDKDGK